MARLLLPRAVELAREHVAQLGVRWAHVQAVGERCEVVCRDHDLPEELALAGWLHDIGYGPLLARSGFHALDGARFLRASGASALVVSLVGYHSGAVFEADERGLSEDLAAIPPPPEDLLDVLTWVDLTTSPAGEKVSVDARLDEIIARYGASGPVARAISRSASPLRQAAGRAAARLGLADVRAVPLV